MTERAGLGVLDDTAQSLFADVDNDGDQDLVLATGTKPLLFLNDGKGRFSVVADAFQFRQPLQGVLTSIAMADYDRDGFLDLYLCVYSYFFGAGEDKAGTPAPYYDARNGPPAVLFRNDGRGRFVDVTAEAGLDAGNDRYHFAAAWADYDDDGWPDLLVANDFGTKNLYRNRGLRDGRVTFEDVAADAGVLDHGAGMSAAFLDYDNDGLLDIYTGNMWSAAGLRVTSAPTFMPDAPPDVRALYRRHVRGQLTSSGTAATGASRTRRSTRAPRWAAGRGPRMRSTSTATAGRTSTSSTACSRGNRMPNRVRRAPNAERRPRMISKDSSGGRSWPARRSRASRHASYDDAWRAINQLLIHGSIASRQRTCSCATTVRAASTMCRARSGSTSIRTVGRSRCSTSTATATRTSWSWRRGRRRSFACSGTISRRKAATLAVRLVGSVAQRATAMRSARGSTVETDRHAPDQDRPGRLRVPVAALEGAALRARRRASAS